jgi:DNA-binding response OmpR family regulator
MRSSKGRILFTEDDPESSELIKFLLQHNGYQVTCCDEAGKALRLAKSEDFDLFLVDNWLPDVTGTELTQKIRQFNQATPILFYSAAAFESDKEEAIKAGAQVYLTKPEGVEDLLGEVDRLINASRKV